MIRNLEEIVGTCENKLQEGFEKPLEDVIVLDDSGGEYDYNI